MKDVQRTERTRCTCLSMLQRTREGWYSGSLLSYGFTLICRLASASLYIPGVVIALTTQVYVRPGFSGCCNVRLVSWVSSPTKPSIVSMSTTTTR
jgi:hypothetical protein